MNQNQETSKTAPRYLDLHALSAAYDKARRARKRQIKALKATKTNS
jgi:hypothetical protein